MRCRYHKFGIALTLWLPFDELASHFRSEPYSVWLESSVGREGAPAMCCKSWLLLLEPSNSQSKICYDCQPLSLLLLISCHNSFFPVFLPPSPVFSQHPHPSTHHYLPTSATALCTPVQLLADCLPIIFVFTAPFVDILLTLLSISVKVSASLSVVPALSTCLPSHTLSFCSR